MSHQHAREPEDPAEEMSNAIRSIEGHFQGGEDAFQSSWISQHEFASGQGIGQVSSNTGPSSARRAVSFPEFNILDSIMSQVDLVPILAAQTPTYDFISLARTCKKFYYAITQNLTSLVLLCARHRAPLAVRTFSYRMYPDLCLPVRFDDPSRQGKPAVRLVAGFRFLKFLEWREKVVRDIVRLLAKDGHRLPIGVKKAMFKFWFMMDLPDNRRRVGIISNPHVWTHRDLFFAVFFMVKLDLRLQHPTQGREGHTLRSLILAQRGLHYLRDVLLRRRLLNETEYRVEMMRTYQRDAYLEPGALDDVEDDWEPLSTFGIPAWRMGADSREYFNPRNRPLVEIDELIVQESARRQLGLERYIESMILWGYIDDQGKDTDVFLKDDQDEDSDWIRALSVGVGRQVRPMQPPDPGWWDDRLINRELSPHEAQVKAALEAYQESMRARRQAAADAAAAQARAAEESARAEVMVDVVEGAEPASTNDSHVGGVGQGAASSSVAGSTRPAAAGPAMPQLQGLNISPQPNLGSGNNITPDTTSTLGSNRDAAVSSRKGKERERFTATVEDADDDDE